MFEDVVSPEGLRKRSSAQIVGNRLDADTSIGTAFYEIPIELDAVIVMTHSGSDWLEVNGGGAPGGGRVKTHMDHRIAMSFLVMGIASRIHTSIDDGNIIATSFPDFAGLMNGLGARIAELETK